MRMPDRVQRSLRSFALALAVFSIAACAAPAPNGDLQAEANASARNAAPAASAPAAPVSDTRQAQATPKPDKPMRTGGPLPPDRIEPKQPEPNRPEPSPPERTGKPVELDFSCKSNSDCEVKNVGNCCGYYPACVNRNSPTDPEGVQAQCAKSGMASVCGWADISACTCRQGRCEAGPNEVTE